MTLSVGNGRYRLDRRIAAGGMGEVWQGTDTALGRQVAVKLLHANISDDPTFRARFEAEARHAAALHDPRIATVFDYGDDVSQQGAHRSYLVMEYVDGKPLSALLRGPLAPEQAAHLLAQAADALEVAHRAGIVHRDVKPANFIVTPDRRVKITDFGVARAKGASSLTDTGTVIGTAAYVAPEVAEGREATPRSDVYSLGVVLYECLAGRRPFEGPSPVAVAIAHLREEPAPLPESVPPRLRALVEQSMAKDPAQRPPTAAAFAAELRAAASGAPFAGPATAVLPAAPVGAAPLTEAGPATATLVAQHPSGPDQSRRRLWPWVAALAAVVLIVAVAFAVAALSGDDEPAADTADRPRGGGAATTEAPRETPRSEQSSEPTTPSETPTTTESTEPETVTIDAADYIGMDAKDAEDQLKDLGLKVKKEDVEGDGVDGTVQDVQPTGEVPVDSEVTLYVWKNPGPEQSPTDTAPGNSGSSNGQGPQ